MKYFFLLPVFLSFNASADFGEIDLIVRESVGYYFSDVGREVDLGSLEYEQDPTVIEGVMIVYTSVNAVQGLTYKWGIHDCETKIQLVNYKDLGSECSFDPNH